MILGVVVTTGATVWTGTVCAGVVCAGVVCAGVRLTTAVLELDFLSNLDELFLPDEYKSFLCAPTVIVTARNAIIITDFFITVFFNGLFPMQK